MKGNKKGTNKKMSTTERWGECGRQNYNTAHPEMEKGEMLLTNVRKNDPYEYARIGWITKRKGEKAYDIGGAFVPSLEPVFVQRKEYKEGNEKNRNKKKESSPGLNKTVTVVEIGGLE